MAASAPKSDDRRRSDKAKSEGDLEDDPDRVGGVRKDEFPVGKERDDRRREDADDVESPDDREGREHSDQERAERPEEPKAQLLQMVEEGHLSCGLFAHRSLVGAARAAPLTLGPDAQEFLRQERGLGARVAIHDLLVDLTRLGCPPDTAECGRAL